MQSQTEDQTGSWVVVVTRLDERRCAELALVLAARGLEHRKTLATDGWQLSVPAGGAGSAAIELAAYRLENPRAPTGHSLEHIDDGRPGVVAYAVVLLTVFVCLRRDLLGFDWLQAGRLQAGQVMSGELWRTVTALTMHLDVDHIASNLAFGGFFGYFVGRHLGTGVGWLAIVSAGALGNLLNAFVQAADHRSIGASTAVFAALGLLTAYSWRRGLFLQTTWRARVAPIVAGIALLAYTGTGGENTDIFAHLTGFVSGFASGVVLARSKRPRTAGAQRICAAIAAAIVITAWCCGLALAG